MSESLERTGFSQSVEILVSPGMVQALVQALTLRVGQLDRHHNGFIGASLRVSEHQGTVHLDVHWASRKASEEASAHARPDDPDWLQVGYDYQARSIIFRTFVVYADVRALD
ncbi:hypothetical protein KDX38_11365 [Pseudomonas sp. CDFA 602]|uniref:hypothetical protein n=1 Tax=Pseudomonas californiensis TaxID=2829823 RepID=UPI001E3A5BA3|nr:hypothetical protein [Pseudomonas californiensis]MCD5994086.1 hypothetical protein [Pseudomonas californiensis]MCD5999815.1 hypothetical protein [Pseudomonas californiensis]